MEILEHRALRGPNFYARFPVIYMMLDIGELEETPSDKIPGLPGRIKAAIPSLVEHRCSPGERGGFFQRLDRGTWAGHIVEHIALELQVLAGMEVGFGKTRENIKRGIYSVVYKHVDEEAGLHAGVKAVEILGDLIAGQPVDLEPIVQNMREMRERNILGPSTQGIVDEAVSRGIPFQRLNSQSHVMLGQGCKQQHIQASMTGQTKARGVSIAADKEWTKQLLDEAGISVPKGRAVADANEAVRVAKQLGYPVVAKPLDANHGRGITTDIHTETELRVAYDAAHEHHDQVIIERFLVGKDHRVLVIGGELIAAARRDPAHVTGDGKSSIQQLIDVVNSDPRRGFGHEKVLTAIHVDHNTNRMLTVQELTLDSVPNVGQEVLLKSTANLSTGGTATDITDEVHPHIQFMARRIAHIVGLDIMGIDIVAPHLRAPLEETGGGIVEVNAGPGLRMHLEPTHGTARNVAKPIMDLMFERGDDGRIPTVAVTGTNGKTTTVRLIAHCLRLHGEQVGIASTGSVEVENQVILRGDYSGPMGTQTVMRDPRVTSAVLEVARGGILRRGMGVDRVDVGILLNVDRDHIGEGDIHDLEDLLRLKATVPDAANTAVLNADDEHVLSLHRDGRLDRQVILFSLDPENPALKSHLEDDPENVVLTFKDGSIELRRGALAFPIAHVSDVPLTMSGRARFNIQNAMAAVAACYALGVPEETVRAALQTFHSTTGQNPGRMNVFEIGSIRAVLDFGHNAAAMRALDEVISYLQPRPDGRVLRVAYLAGNRLDQDLEAMGAALTNHCDKLWISDMDPRGRETGDSCKIIARGAIASGIAADKVVTRIDEWENVREAFAEAKDGDLLILQVQDVKGLITFLREKQAVVA